MEVKKTKMKKRIFSLMLAVFLIIPCAFLFGACGGADNGDGDGTETNAKVMNVSLNPELEFVLDQNDKVLTVNALNEDGNNIISIAIDAEKTFEGLTADEAVNLFLELTKDNGYLITGSNEEVCVKISGEAEELMSKIKNAANNFFAEKGVNSVRIIDGTINKDAILAEVKKCVLEYSEQELAGMTEGQLIDLLKTSREETKNLLTQELKDAYYNMRLEKINIAELEALKKHVNLLSPEIAQSFNDAMKALTDAVDNLEKAYNEQILAEESVYNKAKNTYVAAKEALLKERLALAEAGFPEEKPASLKALEDAVDEAESALANVKTAVDSAIATAKAAIDSAITLAEIHVATVKGLIETYVPGFDAVYENAKQEMKKDFKTYFAGNDQFKDFVGQGHWGKQAA